MPIVWWNPGTAWKVADNSKITPEDVVKDIDEEEEEEEEEAADGSWFLTGINYKTIPMGWWKRLGAFWIERPNVDISWLTEFLSNPTMSLLTRWLWRARDITNLKREEKAKENIKTNLSLSWDIRSDEDVIDNIYWTWVDTSTSTQSTFLPEWLISEKVKENKERESWSWAIWWFFSDLWTFFSKVPAWWWEFTNNIDDKRWWLMELYEYQDEKTALQQTISQLAEIKKQVDEKNVSIEDYNKAYNEILDYIGWDIEKRTTDQYWNVHVTKAQVDDALRKAVEQQIKDNEYEEELDTLDPSRIIERKASNIRLQQWIAKVMTAWVEWINSTKSSVYDKQLNDSMYATASNHISRMNNSINYVGSIMRELVAKAWWDPNNLTGDDKTLYYEALRILEVYDKFIDNMAKLYWRIPYLKDPVTGKIVMPEMIDWKSLHDWMFDWMDKLLYKDSDWWNVLIDHKHISDIDVLENMTQALSYDYVMQNKWLFKRTWEIWQYAVGTIWWWYLTEIEQRYIGKPTWFIYNTVAWEASELNTEYMDQDFSELVTLNTHDTATFRTLQKFAAQNAEYLPELVWWIWEAFAWWWLADAARWTKTMRVIQSEWLRRILSRAFNYAWDLKKWDKLPTLWQKTKNIINNIPKVADDLMTKWKSKIITSDWKIRNKKIEDIGKWGRFFNNLKYDIWTIWWPLDMLFDARYADADLEQGSDTSFIWSIWGTVLWTYLPWVYKTWLFWQASEAVNNAIRRVMDKPIVKKSWWQWWVFDLLDLSSKHKNNPLNNMAKAQFWLNSSKLANFEELASMNDMLREVSDAFTKTYRNLNPAAQKLTDDVVKQIMWQYVNQIFWANTQLSNKIWQLIADERANPADIFKYVLRLRWDVQIAWWRSSIKLADWTRNRFVNFYDEKLDTLSPFRQNWFSKALEEWFTEKDLKYLKDNWYEWADKWNFKKNKDWRYIFTTEWLDKASKDIDSTALDVPVIARASDDAETFDKLMRNSSIKEISDETLDDIKHSWAYDLVSEALWSLSWLCNVWKVW